MDLYLTMTLQQEAAWRTAEQQLDNRIADVIRERHWNHFFESILEDAQETGSFRAFCYHLAYVINTFLEEEDSSELFLQIPIEELYNVREKRQDDTRQVDRWKIIHAIVHACLLHATKDTLLQNIRSTENISGARFEDLNDINQNVAIRRPQGEKYIFYGQQTHRLHRYQELGRWGICTNRRAILQDGNFDSINVSNNLTNRNVGTVIDTAFNSFDKINASKSLQRQYNKALMIRTQAYEQTCIDLRCFSASPTIKQKSIREGNIRVERADIIVIIGDRNYGEICRNAHAQKVIYLGSELPIGQRPMESVYALSFREQYRYCSCNDEYQRYHEPEFIGLDFPWLSERAIELTNILKEFNPREVAEQKIIFSLLLPLSNSDLDNEFLDWFKEYYDLERLRGYFSSDTAINNIQRVSNWIADLKLPQGVRNPKQNWMSNFQRQNTRIPSFSIVGVSKNTSYKYKIKNLVGDNTIILFDSNAYRFQDNPLKYCLRYHLFSQYKMLYYNNIDDVFLRRLNRFFNEEHEQMNSEIRQRYNTNINVLNLPVGNETLANNTDSIVTDDLQELENYYNDDIKDYYYSRFYRRERYRITFSDQTETTLSGEVLFKPNNHEQWKLCSVEDLVTISEFSEGNRLIYYSGGETEDDLYALVDGEAARQRDTYATLWKNRLKDIYNQKICAGRTPEEAIRDISIDSQVSETIINAYCNGSNNAFLQRKIDMKNLCDFLRREKKLSDENYRNILSYARTNRTQPTVIGKLFKEEMLDYRIKQLLSEPTDKEYITIAKICRNNENINAQALADRFLQERCINSVTIIEPN